MPKKKKIPIFKTDRAAAAFVDKAGLAQYDLSGATLTRFEIKRKTRTRGARRCSYQCFTRLTLEQVIAGPE